MTQNGQPHKRRSRGVSPRTSSKIHMGKANTWTRPYELAIQLGTQEPQSLEERLGTQEPQFLKRLQQQKVNGAAVQRLRSRQRATPKKRGSLDLDRNHISASNIAYNASKKETGVGGLWNHGQSRRHERLLNKDGGVANA